jgi:hypothetical protein
MVAFFDWGFLGIGAFNNVYLTNVAPYGNMPANLRLCDDRRYPKGLVWEGFRSNWVWENPVNYPIQPIAISGIYINNSFYPTGVPGPYSYNVSYPLGRVYFDNPINIKSTVQLEYSYKSYQWLTASVQWFRQLSQRLSRIDDRQFNFFGSGVWSIFGDSRVQLPAVVVESLPRRDFKPKMIGGGQWCYQDVLFHIFAETPYDRNTALDIITYQNEKRFFMFDKNLVNAANASPLTIDGYLSNGGNTYPYLVNNYLWTSAIIWGASSNQSTNDAPFLYQSVVRITLEIDMPYL